MGKKRSLTVLALLLIIMGIVLTLENFSILKGVSRFWPLIPLALGMGFILLFFNRKKEDAALIWLASFLALSGALFLYLNFTSWTKLASLWTFFLGIIGLSFAAVSAFIKKRVYMYLAFMFIALFLALYLVFTISLRLWPMSFVVFGLSLLTIDFFSRKK